MIVDAVKLPDGKIVHSDICIIGAGPAGLTLAERLSQTDMSICLLESGGLTFERDAQDLSKGTTIGQPYEALHLCRVRQFGGSTGPQGWGGWCKALQPFDFEQRSWIPLSGWPIDYKDLEPYYKKAFASFGFSGAQSHRPGITELAGTSLAAEFCFLAHGESLLSRAKANLKRSRNVNVILHATAVEIVAEQNTSKVTCARAKSARNKELMVFSKIFVLACGGIENARLMLASNRHCDAGLANELDVVGRYFMEHPTISWGQILTSSGSRSLHIFDPAAVYKQAARNRGGSIDDLTAAGLVIPPEVLEKEQILCSRTWLKPTSPRGYGDGARALQEMTFWMRKGRGPDRLSKHLRDIMYNPGDVAAAAWHRFSRPWMKSNRLQFTTIMEQEPNRINRVTLSNELDALGSPRARLEWHLGPLFEKTLVRTQELLIDGLKSLGYDCSIDVAPYSRDKRGLKNSVRWVRHHMGTTRMSIDPRYGVVDPDCRVYGVDNLFISGSSVFPTGGNDMPTLTIVALAHRLADHLIQLSSYTSILSSHQGVWLRQ